MSGPAAGKATLSDRAMPPSGTPILEVRDLDVYYGAVHALKRVTVTAHAGEIVTLIGANGAGKTTLLRTISGLVRTRSGKILFEGRDVTKVPAHEIVALGISQSPEGRMVFDGMYSLFPRLQERRKQMAGTLSGGEQQMLAIARAMMARPRLLLLDEPSLGIAPIMMREIFQTIKAINQRGMTVLLVEQNAHMALAIARRGYVLETGSVRLEDSAANLLKNDEVRKAYLGG